MFNKQYFLANLFDLTNLVFKLLLIALIFSDKSIEEEVLIKVILSSIEFKRIVNLLNSFSLSCSELTKTLNPLIWITEKWLKIPKLFFLVTTILSLIISWYGIKWAVVVFVSLLYFLTPTQYFIALNPNT